MQRVAIMVSLAIAGCFDPVPAAPPDGPPPDAAHGPVTVTVLSYAGNEAPVPNATVVASHHGLPVISALTNAAGQASLEIPPNATVMVIMPPNAGATAVAIVTEVQPFDALTFARPPVASSMALGSMSVTWPAGTATTGFHEVHTSCGVVASGVTAPTSLALNTDCEPTFGATGLEYDGALRLLRQTPVQDVMLQGGGTIVLGDLATAPTVALRYTNANAAVSALWCNLDPTGAAVLCQYPTLTVDGTNANGTVADATLWPERLLVTTQQPSNMPSVTAQRAAVRMDPVADVPMDAQALQVRWMASASTYEANTRALAWNQVGTDDAVVQHHTFSGDDPSSGARYDVSITAPAEAGAMFTLPMTGTTVDTIIDGLLARLKGPITSTVYGFNAGVTWADVRPVVGTATTPYGAFREPFLLLPAVTTVRSSR